LKILCADAANGTGIDELRANVLNTPLDIDKGELIRFSLIDDDHQAEVVMSWSHALMDAHGAEAFLALIGDSEDKHPADTLIGQRAEYTRRVFRNRRLWSELKLAWTALRRLDSMAKPPPLSIYTVRSNRIEPRQVSRFVSFSREETEIIRQNSSAICGFLGETNYYLATSLLQLKEICAVCGVPADSYVVNLPVDARDKGSNHPIFSNFSSFITYYVKREQLSDLNTTVESLQKQTRESIRDRLGEGFDSVSSLVRLFPPQLYWNRMKPALNGEIGSTFFANTGNVLPCLERFLGREVLHVRHATSITAPPGIGVFFYSFRSRLYCTIGFIKGVLDESEVSVFEENLRRQLLNPTHKGA